MRIPWVFARDNIACPTGTQYYTCAANNYEGCCSVNACDFDEGCPPGSSTAAAATTATATPTSTTSTTSTSKPTATATATPTSSPKPTTSPSASTIHPTSASTSTSTPSTPTTSASETTGTPSSTATAAGDVGQGTTQHKLSGGAIGGIVTAGVIAFVVLFGVFLWRMHRRNKELEQQAAALASGAAGAGAGAGTGGGHPGLPSAVLSPGYPQTTPSPGLTLLTQDSPALDEKTAGSVSQRDSLLLHDASGLGSSHNGSNQLGIHGQPNNGNGANNNYTAHAKMADLEGTPASVTIPLFGEAPAGQPPEGEIARWGLHGARLAAQRRSQMHGSVREGDNVDFGGSYLGPGAEPGGSPPPAPLPRAQPGVRIAELDGQRSPDIAELETPLPAPMPTPLTTPGMGSYSPALSGTGTMGSGGRSTMVSSWRDSTRTVASASDGHAIPEELISELDTGAATAPELDATPRLLPLGTPPQQPHSPTRNGSVADTPRATLEVSPTERRRGVNVTSWGSYNP
ncbi:hypothetical protein SCUCBS95973_000899 [Sporothrix curviconia]|uniref:Uncharacterized protein n=1 Tax=Sporothrix curviconia TaxID=1260050 RepID=A0ABP0AU36_9PEZI